MIKNADEKKITLVKTINESIAQMDKKYRTGPSLYFYKKTLENRLKYDSVEKYLSNEYNLEIMYAALVAWDMDSRGAKLTDFDCFQNNILNNIDLFNYIETAGINLLSTNIFMVTRIVKKLYATLNIMKTDAKTVAHSKLLHFIFPDLFMPIDRKNTLTFFYGNTNESLNKFIEIINFSYDFVKDNNEISTFIGTGKWNTSIPKIIDNAIIINMGVSIN
jgi:hypothetical protein